MIDPSRQYNHIPLFYPNPDPTVIFAADVKVSTTFQAVADFFISVDVLSVEVLQLLLIVVNLPRA